MMYRRLLARFIKLVTAILLYATAYLLINYMFTPKASYNFVSDDYRIGDKFIFIHLEGKAPQLSDPEGYDVFRLRKCEPCFVTNNKGFLPLSEYDAMVVHGNKQVLADSSAYMYPEKKFLMEVDQSCLDKKLKNCASEPKFTSFETLKEYGVCDLCRYLHEKRRKYLYKKIYKYLGT